MEKIDLQVNPTAVNHLHRDEFQELVSAMQNYVDNHPLIHDGTTIYKTPSAGLMKAFLDGMEGAVRQEHTCHCCSNFMRHFGSLVVLEENGAHHSLFWPHESEVPEMYRQSVKNVREYIHNKKNLPFKPVHPFDVFGISEKGGYNHFQVSIPYETRQLLTNTNRLPRSLQENFGQAFGVFRKQLSNISTHALRAAKHMFENGTLNHNKEENIRCLIAMLLAKDIVSSSDEYKVNRLLDMFTHAAPMEQSFNSSILGMLVKDISNLDADHAIRRYKDATGSLQYRRAQVDSTVKQIEVAKKAIAEMGMTKSLVYQLATMEDLEAANLLLWKPTEVTTPVEVEKEEDDLFAKKLGQAKGNSKLDAILASEGVPTTINFREFYQQILPKAKQILIRFNGVKTNGGFVERAKYMDLPSAIKYKDKEGKPVPFLTPYFHNGIDTRLFAERGQWATVKGVLAQPAFIHENAIDNEEYYTRKRVEFLLEMVDDNGTIPMVLFPSELINELQPYRKVIENITNDNHVPFDKGSIVTATCDGTGGSGIVIKVVSDEGTRLFTFADSRL